MHLIDGKKLAAEIIEAVTQQITNEGLEPQLAVVLVGSDPASQLYVRLKEKTSKKAGIIFNKYLIAENEPEEKIVDTIQFLNHDPEIDAILIQLPLPKKFNQQRIIDAMDYRKDVDGFHPKNIDSYVSGKAQKILPGLSLAIWKLIEATGEKNYTGKNVLIIGKSDVFTKPTKRLLETHGLRSDIAHPNDSQLMEKTLASNIIVSAIGKLNSITAEMIREGSIIIDVGINKTSNGTIAGDVDFKNVAPKCAYITPVPGGVGPMTVAMLLYNTLILARNKYN